MITKHHMASSELEDLVASAYAPLFPYDFLRSQGIYELYGEDARTIEFTVDGVVSEAGEDLLAAFSMGDLEDTADDLDGLTELLLDDLARQGRIPVGVYVIEISEFL